MADEHVATYLNDHLAGSVVALELLDHLEATHSDSALRDFFRQLRADIDADRDDLQGLWSVCISARAARERHRHGWPKK